MFVRLTPAGRLLLLFAASIGFAAINTGNNLLYLLLALILASFSLSCLGGLAHLRGIHLRPIDTVFASRGEPATSELELARPDGRRPTYGLELRVADGDEGRARIAVLPPRGRLRTGVQQPPRERGVHPWASLELSTVQPLGLLRVGRRLAVDADVVVHPRVVPTDPPRQDAPGECVSEARHRRGDGYDLLALREASPDDEARRIDWKASAKAQRLMAREHAGEEYSGYTVHVPSPPDGDDAEERWETTLDGAASTVVAGLEAGLPIGLTGPTGSWPQRSGPEQRRRLLRALAELPAAAETGR